MCTDGPVMMWAMAKWEQGDRIVLWLLGQFSERALKREKESFRSVLGVIVVVLRSVVLSLLTESLM